jgi:hypothetical protein
LQAMVGLKASNRPVRERPGEDASRRALVSQRVTELKQAIPQGGAREAVIRALLYIRLPEGVADERGFNLLRRMRHDAGQGLSLSDFKQLVREQFFMLLLDERRAVEAIPAMLDRDPDLSARMGTNLRKLIEVVGVRSDISRERLAECERMFKAAIGRHSGRRSVHDEPLLEPAEAVRVHATRSTKHA